MSEITEVKVTIAKSNLERKSFREEVQSFSQILGTIMEHRLPSGKPVMDVLMGRKSGMAYDLAFTSLVIDHVKETFETLGYTPNISFNVHKIEDCDERNAATVGFPDPQDAMLFKLAYGAAQ